jgi:hypothetical protein
METRDLTQEEQERKITIRRFNKFHNTAQEDFLDVHPENGLLKVFGGFLLYKYRHISDQILLVCNRVGGETTGFMELDGFDPSENDRFYTEFAEFCNLTVATKARVNAALILTEEHYDNN